MSYHRGITAGMGESATVAFLQQPKARTAPNMATLAIIAALGVGGFLVYRHLKKKETVTL